MPDPATVSAVIPAYNCGRYLPAAVASIREQTRPVAEIVIVDDGSGDDTPALASDLGPGIHYIRQANAGPAAARNRGIEAASGELIAFLDADDQWAPDKTERQLAVLEAHSDLALVASDMAEIDDWDEVRIASVLAQHGLRGAFETLAGGPIPEALAKLVRKNFIPTGTVLVRRQALQEAGGFDRRFRYGEDLELWAKIAARHPIACLPEVLMLRRRHGFNATAAGAPMFEDLVGVMRAIRDWGAAELRRQGVDPDRLVASALADLGYLRFTAGELPAARRAFFASLRERPNLRAGAYAGASLLPAAAVRRLRRLKQRASARKIHR